MTDNLLSREIIHKLDDRSVEEHLRDHYRDIFRLYQGLFVDVGNGLVTFPNDVIFSGGGLPFGSFWGNGIGFTTAGGTGTFTEISDADVTVGQANNTTFQNNKELAVTYEGMYSVTWSMSAKATGANKHIVGGIGVDVGGTGSLAIQNDGRNKNVSTGNAEFPLAGTAILDLSVDSEVGLMITNETDNTDVTVEYINLKITQRGGT